MRGFSASSRWLASLDSGSQEIVLSPMLGQPYPMTVAGAVGGAGVKRPLSVRLRQSNGLPSLALRTAQGVTMKRLFALFGLLVLCNSASAAGFASIFEDSITVAVLVVNAVLLGCFLWQFDGFAFLHGAEFLTGLGASGVSNERRDL